MNRIIEAIQQLLEAAVANSSSPLYYHATTNPFGVRSVYFGDPIQVEKSSHPALIVHPVGTSYEARGSRYDRKIHSVEIRLVDNIDNYLATTPADVRKVTTVSRFGDMIEKSNAAQSVASLTICGIIQNNANLPYLDPDNSDAQAYAADDAKIRAVNYVFNSARGYPTFEAIILVDVVAQGDR